MTVESEIRKSTMMSVDGINFIKNKLLSLIQNNVSGDVVECGVWMGGCSATLAQAMLSWKQERTLRLFDSFDDICEPLPLDGKRLIKQVGGIKNAQGRLQPIKGFYKGRKLVGPGNEAHVEKLLTEVVGYPKDKVKIYKGWFQNTIAPSSTEIDKISLLILDCDLYISIKTCLDNLYDKLSSGGVIIIDDYHYYDGCKKAVDDFLRHRKISVKIPTTGYAWWVKK